MLSKLNAQRGNGSFPGYLRIPSLVGVFWEFMISRCEIGKYYLSTCLFSFCLCNYSTMGERKCVDTELSEG